MALKTAMKRVRDARHKYEKELKTVGRSAQKDVAKHLAALIPDGYAVQWSQYTPHFNDGDACEFSVNNLSIFLVEVESHEECARPDDQPDCPEDCPNGIVEKRDSIEYDDDFSIEDIEYLSDSDDMLEGVTKKDLGALKRAFKALDEGFMLAAFGDHAGRRVLDWAVYRQRARA